MEQIQKLSYLIDLTFTNVNRLFVLSFQRIAGDNNTKKIIETLFHIIIYQTLKLKTSMF